MISFFVVPYAEVNFLKDSRFRELDSDVENKSLFRHQKYQQKIKSKGYNLWNGSQTAA